MKLRAVSVRLMPPFGDQWEELSPLAQFNVLIGRNNSGKSHLAKLLTCPKLSSLPTRAEIRHEYVATKALVDHIVEQLPELQEHLTRKELQVAIGTPTRFLLSKPSADTKTEFDLVGGEMPIPQEYVQQVKELLGDCVPAGPPLLQAAHVVTIAAERDIVPETFDLVVSRQMAGSGVEANGSGVTSFLANHTHNDSSLRRSFEAEFIVAVKSILGSDMQLEDIRVVRRLPNADNEELWEIKFSEKNKPEVHLSSSGTGLKTILLVVVQMILVPMVQGLDTPVVYVFEELENNLHPALFRRLLEFVRDRITKTHSHLVLTTHSSIAVDYFAGLESSSISLVRQVDGVTKVTPCNNAYGASHVLSDIGAKPSDLLMSNCMIWVEGPSDRTYLNRWIGLMCEHLGIPGYREGRHYQIAFYGGSTISHMEASEAWISETDLINILKMNPNTILVCDSDRDHEDSPLKASVQRIQAQLAKTGMCWVTAGREIENYIPSACLTDIDGNIPQSDIDVYQCFWPRANDNGSSYLQSVLKRNTVDKTSLARMVSPRMTFEHMESRLDWFKQMKKIVERITLWNE